MFNLLDLPKQLDALVTGVIQLIYGVVGAWGLAVFKPVRGSLYLSRVAKAPVSSHVALLLGASLCALMGGAYDNYLDPLGRAASGAGLKDLWRFLLTTLVFFLTLDGVSHLLGMIGNSRGRRHGRAVGMCRYAIAGAAAAIGLGGVLINALIIDRPGGATQDIEGWIQIFEVVFSAGMTVFMVAVAAFPLRVGFAVARRRLPRGLLAIPIYFIPGLVLLLGLYVAACTWTYFDGSPNSQIAVPTATQRLL